MTTDWVIAKFTYLTFDPTGGRGGKFLITVMLIYRHWVIIAYSEKLLYIIVLDKCDVYSTKSQYSF